MLTKAYQCLSNDKNWEICKEFENPQEESRNPYDQ